MRLKPDQIAARLERDGLAPVYLFSGEEPLQLMEAADAVRAAARASGYSERIVLDVETGFDWNALRQEAESMSLFAAQRLIDLRLGTGKPGTDGARALADYAAAPPPDTVLLVTLQSRLDQRSQQAQWFKAVDRSGIVVQVWPIDAGALPGWLQRRAQALGLQLTADGAELVAERVEGNMLAASQELELLRLLASGPEVVAEDILAVVGDSARYDAFKLVDAALEGNAGRVLRVLRGLKGEGAEPLAVCGALSWQLRRLCAMAAGGGGNGAAFGGGRDRRGDALRVALRRHDAAYWRRLLREAGRIERLAKGVGSGRPWDELQRLCLAMAGTDVCSAPRKAAGGYAPQA